MKKEEELMKIFPLKLRKVIFDSISDFSQLQEIRLRANRPLVVRYHNQNYYITVSGILSDKQEKAVFVTNVEIKEVMEYVSNYSLYAFEEEVRNGFITVAGGHRVGIAGKVIYENGLIRSMKYISFLCIRIAHEVIGCSDKIYPFLVQNGVVAHTLIISPPGYGKTTLLRDLVRRISNGDSKMEKGINVGLVDERSEIASCYMGVPQNDIGVRTDVYDCCPKTVGITLLIRSMAPTVIAVDEIGTEQDIKSLSFAFGCGCKILATVHGASLSDIEEKPLWKEVVKQKLFERYVVIGFKNGNRKTEVFDADGSVLGSNQ